MLMKLIKVEGVLSNANVCTVSLMIFQNGTILRAMQYYGSFHSRFLVDPGTYTIGIHGFTEGKFEFSVGGPDVQSANPNTPVQFSKNISGKFDITTTKP